MQSVISILARDADADVATLVASSLPEPLPSTYFPFISLTF